MTTLREQGLDLEPMCLLDTTGSMNFKAALSSNTKRRDVVGEAMRIVVARLAAEDKAGEHEEGGGGLRVVTFADGTSRDLGDLNSANFQQVWSRIHWQGGTQIMPGMKQILKIYTDEFTAEPKPALALLTVLDGEADDIREFERTIAAAKGNLYVGIAIVGYGSEHDAAKAQFDSIALTNSHVRVVSLDSETDPETVAEALLSMLA